MPQRKSVRKERDTSTSNEGRAGEALAVAIGRSAIVRKVPARVRYRLDEAILRRPKGCETLEAIAARFSLQSRYGVSLDVLKRYARKLEAMVRPIVAAHVMAGVLGCLPARYRKRIHDGSEVMLLSRVIAALGDENNKELPVSELAKLATVLKAVGGRAAGKRRTSSRKQKKDVSLVGAVGSVEPSKLTEAVRMVYGIDLPGK